MNFHDVKLVSPPPCEHIMCWNSYTGEAFLNYRLSNKHNNFYLDDREFDFWGRVWYSARR